MHNDRFLQIWTEELVKHGLHMICLIIDEEKIQQQDLEIQLKDSIKLLDEYQDVDEFGRFNERLKKEVEEFQKEQKIGKQKKFQRDLTDFEIGNILDLERKRGRHRSCSRPRIQNDRNNSKE